MHKKGLLSGTLSPRDECERNIFNGDTEPTISLRVHRYVSDTEGAKVEETHEKYYRAYTYAPDTQLKVALLVRLRTVA